MIRTNYILFALYFLFMGVFLINFFAAQYATVLMGPSVPDFFDFFGDEKYSFIRNIAIKMHLFWSVFLLFPFFVYGTIFFPKKMIQYLSLTVIIILIRMFTMNMTHLGKVANQPAIYGYDFTFGGDLFFSGHVAYTFLLYLVFRNTSIKYIILFFHVIITASVIVGRFHYTIDVIGAYTITYTIFKLTEPLLAKLDKRFF